MKSRLTTQLATRVYRSCFPYLLALLSIPTYLVKYRRYHSVGCIEKGFADHRRQQAHIPRETFVRLLKAYNKAKIEQETVAQPYKVGYLWQEILDTRFKKLTNALNSCDYAKARNILENFNREDCGDDTCGGGQYFQRMKRVPFYKYQYINAWYRRFNACKKALGYEPTFNLKSIGNPVGMYYQGQTVPLCNLEYYYYAANIQSLLAHTANPRVCEIGGGVGGQAYEVLSLGVPNLTYILLDIPEVLLISSYYLMMAFPETKFLLYGEVADEYDVVLMPNFALPNMVDNSVDLFFNSCSFSEMNYDTTKEYLNQIKRICRRYLMHINHNARLSWHENGKRITNMIANEVIPSKFNKVYQKPRLFSLLEDTFVIHWFYRAKYYHYLYERIK